MENLIKILSEKYWTDMKTTAELYLKWFDLRKKKKKIQEFWTEIAISSIWLLDWIDTFYDNPEEESNIIEQLNQIINK